MAIGQCPPSYWCPGAHPLYSGHTLATGPRWVLGCWDTTAVKTRPDLGFCKSEVSKLSRMEEGRSNKVVFYTIMVIIGNILRSQNPEWIILSLQCSLPQSQSQLLYIQAAYLHTPLLKLCRTRQSLTFTLFCWHNFTIQLRLPAQGPG